MASNSSANKSKVGTSAGWAHMNKEHEWRPGQHIREQGEHKHRVLLLVSKHVLYICMLIFNF